MNPGTTLSALGFAAALLVSCGDAALAPRGGAGNSGAAPSSGGASHSAGGARHNAGGVSGDGGSGGDTVAGGAGDATAADAGANSGGASAGNAGDDDHLEPGGAGSGGGSGGPSVDGSSIVFAFPPPHSYTDAPQLTIRGSATDPDGVAGVSIAGVNAETTDAFATFRLTVPTPAGRNRFSVSVTDQLGNVTRGAELEIVNQGTSLINARAMEFDPASHSLFVSDYWASALVKIDIDTGVATTISGLGHGSGEEFNGSIGLALDLENRRALTQHWGSDVLLGIDLQTGQREVVSRGGQGSPSIAYASGLAVDAEHGRAFAVDRTAAVAIDLATGKRTLVTSADRGTGYPLKGLDDVVYDGVSGPVPRLLVSDRESQAIVAVDIASGDRTLFSAVDRGTGLGFSEPSRLELDATRRRLLVVDGSGVPDAHTSYRVNRAALVAVDLSSGDRSTLSDPFQGDGFLPETPYALAFDGSRAYLANDWGGQIAQIDLASKQRKLLTSSDVGSGYKPYTPEALAPFVSTDDEHELLMLEELAPAIVRVNLITGTRTVLSGATRGAGPALQLGADFVVAAPQSGTPSRAFVLDARRAGIVAVNLETGDRTMVSDPSTGTGPELGPSDSYSAQALALDSTRNQLLVSTSRYGTSSAAVIAVDLTTGDRRLLSGTQRGTGPDVNPLSEGLLVDPYAPPGVPRAFFLNTSAVLTVDLNTGDRAMLSYGYSPTIGLGPALTYANDLDINPLNHTLVVSCWSILADVRLDNGNRGILSGRDAQTDTLVGLGPELDRPNGVLFDARRNVTYISNPLRGALFAVDMTTGDRVIIAR